MKQINSADQKEIEALMDRMREIFIEARGGTPRRQLATSLSINESTAMRIENGDHDMDMRYFLKLCKVYDLDPVLTFQKAYLTAGK